MLHLKWSLIGIGIAITLSLVTEFQINTVPAVATLHLKSIPAFVALASFIVVYLVYWYKVRPKITAGLAVFVAVPVVAPPVVLTAAAAAVLAPTAPPTPPPPPWADDELVRLVWW